MHHQEIHSVRCVKGSPSGRRKIMPDGNESLHKGKNNGNGNV